MDTHEALFDELFKIAVAKVPEDKKSKLKKWLKNTALVSAGAATGSGLAQLADAHFSSKLGPTWRSASPELKKWLVGPAIGAATVGLMLSKKKLDAAKVKADE